MEIENYEQYHQFLRRQLAYRKRTHFSERLWKVTLTGKSNNHVRLGNCYVRLGALLLKCIHGLHIILDIQFQILIGKTRLFLMKAYIIYLFWCSAFYSAFQMAPNCLQPQLFVESSGRTEKRPRGPRTTHTTHCSKGAELIFRTESFLRVVFRFTEIGPTSTIGVYFF